MTALPKRHLSEEAYLAIERSAESKTEYWDGEMYSMAGAGATHGRIVWNVGATLHAQFKGRPRTGYTSDMRVRVADSGLYTYPDVIALCGDAEYLDERCDTLLNPQLVVEVLSPTTAAYDRGEKLRRYRQLASLTDYVLISQDRLLVEHWHREVAMPHVWTPLEYSRLSDRVQLAALNAELTLSDIYDKVELRLLKMPSR